MCIIMQKFHFTNKNDDFATRLRVDKRNNFVVGVWFYYIFYIII